MSTLVDTNVLARGVQTSHPMQPVAARAVAALRQQGEQLFVVPQNYYEFWAVCTRPVAANGLGLTVTATRAEITRLKGLFLFREDNPAVFLEWERLVVAHQVSGKNAHDARLVAAMMVHGLGRLLTFNAGDFQRYPAITVVTPQQVLAAPPPTP